MKRIGAVAISSLLGAALSLRAGPTEPLVVDTAASRVRIHLGRTGLLKFLGHDHEIDAPLAEGRIEVVEGEPARSFVRLRFEAGRLAIVPGTEPAGDIPKVEARMRGPEVLEVARYPEIVFTSSSVAGEALGPGRYRLRVRGTLELKGRSFPVESRSRSARLALRSRPAARSSGACATSASSRRRWPASSTWRTRFG